ncbi:MAG: polysaccharide deacetylase [Lachnospiraceae bacterium]|nr:polysaccharide deacetylase [Lachnospiraceae bacterium]MDD7177462.1 polysaccharide deacetylase [bacterium]MDY5516464.1 polysaccharide deacetylase family protein [Lachnospiraceae bacterium]
MSNKNTKQSTPQGLKEQRARRQRINRIKTGIVLFMVAWMILCMVMNVFLMVRVSSLQDQIGILAEKMIERAQVQTPEVQAPSPEAEGDYATYDDPAEAEGEKDEPAQEETPVANEKIRDCIALEDNLRGEDDPMTVYLTFDDGPSKNTPEILAILKKHGVKATFFVTGKEGEEAEQWYQQIVADGHTLGMHSYSHKYSTIYESVDAFSADFNKLHDYLKDVTGVDCRFYRFPGGSSNQVSNIDMNEFIDFLGEKGMTYYDWNVVCGDATSQIYTADELVKNVMTDVVKYKYSVVLMHDAADKDSTVEALEKILQKLEEMDAEILPITEDAQVIHHNLS